MAPMASSRSASCTLCTPKEGRWRNVNSSSLTTSPTSAIIRDAPMQLATRLMPLGLPALLDPPDLLRMRDVLDNPLDEPPPLLAQPCAVLRPEPSKMLLRRWYRRVSGKVLRIEEVVEERGEFDDERVH